MKDPISAGFHEMVEDDPLTADEKTETPKANGHAAEGAADTRSADETLAQLHYGTGRFHSDLLHYTFMSTVVDLQLAEVTVNRGFNRAREVLRDAPKESEEWRWGSDRWSIEEMVYSLINKDHSLAGLLPPHLLTVWNDCVAAGLEPRIDGHLGEPWRVVVDKPAAVAAETTWPTPYSARKASAIPRRLWLWGQHYMRGVASITAAPGAAGKSQHSLVEAVGMAAGRDLITGETKKRRLRVWVWNAEDDVDEMERRVSGICDYYGIDRESLRGWLFLDSGYELPFEFAAGGRTAVIKEAAIQAAANQIAKRQIDVVIFDPLISVHSLSETDQTNLAKLLRVLGNRIAKSCNCALEIVHHTRKAGKGDDNGMTTDDIRGAGSIVYVPRSGRLLHPMSASEAEKYGISPEDRPRYVRLERAKPNMAKRGTIYWLHLAVWDVGNDGDGEPSDTVTVPTLWTPKAVIDSITDAAVTSIRTTIAEGEFRRDKRATAWAGKVVAQACKLDLAKVSGKAQATNILDHLIDTKVLGTVFRPDKKRMTREYVVPGEKPQ